MIRRIPNLPIGQMEDDKEGHLIGVAIDNPMLDTQEYKVEFLDGHCKSLSANVIAQHLFSQIDEEGHQHLLLDDIIDFCRDDTAVDKELQVDYTRVAAVMSVEGWQH